MEPQSQNTMPQMPQMPMQNEKSVGPVIGIIIIIIIIVLGGLYFWGQRINNSQPNELQTQDETTTPGTDVNQLKSQSSSDDVSSIEADLRATNFDSLGTEVNSMDAEAQAQ